MIDRLIEKIQKTEAPIVVGLDPQMSFIPGWILEQAYREFGETLEGAAEAVWQFNKGIIDAVCDLVPAVKPQIAMYEQFGVPGLAAFQKTVSYCRQKGLVVIGDIKRGDIGSTSAAYATGHLGKIRIGEKEYAPFDEDMATVNPYLGTDGVKPFLKVCAEEDKGIFVLVKTSNPSSGEFQDRCVALAESEDGPVSVFLSGGGKPGGRSLPEHSEELLKVLGNLQFRPLYEIVGEKVAEWAQEPALIGKYGYSEVGAVVGATYPEMGAVLRKIMPRSYILVPGYGAQGGTGRDLTAFFNEDGLGAIVNSSRGIIAAWTKEPYAEKYGADHYADAARAAVLDMKEDIRQALG